MTKCDEIAMAAIAGKRFIWTHAFVEDSCEWQEVTRTTEHVVFHCGKDDLG